MGRFKTKMLQYWIPIVAISATVVSVGIAGLSVTYSSVDFVKTNIAAPSLDKRYAQREKLEKDIKEAGKEHGSKHDREWSNHTVRHNELKEERGDIANKQDWHAERIAALEVHVETIKSDVKDIKKGINAILGQRK